MNLLYWLAQLAVLVMGVMAGVRGSLTVTGSWTVTGWPARVVGWSFVLAAAWSMSWPGLLLAPDFELQTTTVQALAPALGPYLLALIVTAVVLVWIRRELLKLLWIVPAFIAVAIGFAFLRGDADKTVTTPRVPQQASRAPNIAAFPQQARDTAAVIQNETIATKIPQQSSRGLDERLRDAVNMGDMNEAAALLKQGAAVNAADKDGWTLLHEAALRGHETVVRLLLEKGAAVNAADKAGETPLHWAAGYGHAAVARLLLDKGAAVNAANTFGGTPLYAAAGNGHKAVVTLLLERGATIDTKAVNSGGRTLLYAAAVGGLKAFAQLLLDKGAAVNTADKDGWTPLHGAASNGHAAVARLLLDRGAAVNAAGNGGLTPLHLAVGGGHEAVVRLLLDKGAAVTAADKFGRTPLHQAAEENREAVVRLLLEKGASVNAASAYGLRPLHLAARRGHEAVVQLLLKKGAPVNAADKAGETPLHEAAGRGHETVVQLLLKKGASVNAADNRGKTSLNHAADKGREAVVRLLLEKGAGVDVKDTSGKSPLDVARGRGKVGTVTGTVTYTGIAVEKEFFFKQSVSPQFCRKIGTDGHKPDLVRGDKRILKTIEVGKAGALNAAVVAVTDIEDSVWMMDGYKGTEVVIKFCEYLPYTGVVVNRQNFRVENRDQDTDDPKFVTGVLHNPHSFEVKGSSMTTIFNIGLPKKGSMLEKKVNLRKENQGSFLRLGCDTHFGWEQAYFLPVKNPHYGVTGADGTFTIENVPAGKHRVLAWHPFAGQVEADVDVKDGATVTANFRIIKK